MLLLASILLIISLLIVNENGQLSPQKFRWAAAIAILIVSGILFAQELGTLRAVFVLLAMGSLLGTLMTLWQWRINLTRS